MITRAEFVTIVLATVAISWANHRPQDNGKKNLVQMITGN